MPFDFNTLTRDHRGMAFGGYEAHANPRFAAAVKTIGFSRISWRARHCCCHVEAGRQYLDMLCGYGVFNVGRYHPAVKQAMIDFMNADKSSLVQMEIPVLRGMLARAFGQRTDQARVRATDRVAIE